MTDVAREAATGKAVLHRHRDRLGRPVILVRASRHVIGGWCLVSLRGHCGGCEERSTGLPREPGVCAMSHVGCGPMRGMPSRHEPPPPCFHAGSAVAAGQAPLVESERLCVHLLDRALAELEAEGAARRTVLGVFDMRGFTTR